GARGIGGPLCQHQRRARDPRLQGVAAAAAVLLGLCSPGAAKAGPVLQQRLRRPRHLQV
ncbi:unnamed protein product, partial [Prorocentrum cordatum]